MWRRPKQWRHKQVSNVKLYSPSVQYSLNQLPLNLFKSLLWGTSSAITSVSCVYSLTRSSWIVPVCAEMTSSWKARGRGLRDAARFCDLNDSDSFCLPRVLFADITIVKGRGLFYLIAGCDIVNAWQKGEMCDKMLLWSIFVASNKQQDNTAFMKVVLYCLPATWPFGITTGRGRAGGSDMFSTR